MSPVTPRSVLNVNGTPCARKSTTPALMKSFPSGSGIFSATPRERIAVTSPFSSETKTLNVYGSPVRVLPFALNVSCSTMFHSHELTALVEEVGFGSPEGFLTSSGKLQIPVTVSVNVPSNETFVGGPAAA
jgi:hypothetical protein